MEIEFLKKESDNTRLILIVAGWSAGPEIARHVAMPGWDVAVMYDFTELSFDNSVLGEYYTVYLFAWSLGVYAAARLIDPTRITAAYAINGTLQPISDEAGIPESTYRCTMNSLDERNLFKFRLRMAGNKAKAVELSDNGESDIENLKSQLYNIQGDYADNGHLVNELPWIRAFVSGDDRIFPPEAQKRAWKGLEDVEIIELNAPHYVDLEGIVRMVIADTDTVSRRFRRASVSYDTHAIAQYSAAMKLAGYLKEMTPKRDGSLAEIGCGTGLFTGEYSRFLKPDSAVFVDITPTGPFGIAEEERYVVMDAEKWIDACVDKYDFIVSASAIQWFADIPRFLHLCSRRLNEGGVMAVSTFLPGNLGELDEVRPNPLRYPTAIQLYNWLKEDYADIRVIEDEIRVEFKSHREMLMHLKHTGVAGSAPGGALPMKDMTHLRSLTYRPVYILAKRK